MTIFYDFYKFIDFSITTSPNLMAMPQLDRACYGEHFHIRYMWVGQATPQWQVKNIAKLHDFKHQNFCFFIFSNADRPTQFFSFLILTGEVLVHGEKVKSAKKSFLKVVKFSIFYPGPLVPSPRNKCAFINLLPLLLQSILQHDRIKNLEFNASKAQYISWGHSVVMYPRSKRTPFKPDFC